MKEVFVKSRNSPAHDLSSGHGAEPENGQKISEPEPFGAHEAKNGAEHGVPAVLRAPPAPVEDNPDGDSDLSIIEPSDEVRSFDTNAPISHDDVISTRADSFVPNNDAPYLPIEIREEIGKFKEEEFVKNFFRCHRTNHKFSRKRIATESLTLFSREPIQHSILNKLEPKIEKLAIQCFKWILCYTGIESAKNPASYADKLIQTLYANPSLRDEIMFQLIKQTTGNPDESSLKKSWELFLIIVTFFPSTKNSEIWIKKYFWETSKTSSESIKSLAEFCHIRFMARCAVGKELEAIQFGPIIQRIPTEFMTGHLTFGASIYEQLWNQRRSVRYLPIPYIMHHMAEVLLKSDCEQRQGLFRLTGNLQKVDEMAKETNEGRNAISSADVIDVSCLFKKWFRDLPDPVCSMDRMNDLENAYETKNYVAFTKLLSRAHRLTLMYLIGFLQRLVRAEAKTLMGAKNLAIVFGPNIVQRNDVKEPAVLQLFSDIGIEFLTNLIQEWDTGEMYPLDLNLLRE
jgi:hypothetical protein